MKSESFHGLNIQFPISREILSGRKTVETRTYPLPKSYIGKILLLIETPGKNGKFKARIVGKICFSNCFLYSSKAAFYRDSYKHLVTPDSPWAWTDKPKWGWIIESVERLSKPVPAGRIGIKYTKNIQLGP